MDQFSSTENEKLQKLKQKKENQDKKKDKNVNVYTIGPKDNYYTEFVIQRTLESLGEITNDKQHGKKNQKTPKVSNNKQSSITGTEKSKSQCRSYEKTSTNPSSETPNKKMS